MEFADGVPLVSADGGQSEPAGNYTLRSLFFCLALDNPFHPDLRHEPLVDDDCFEPQQETEFNPQTFLQDEAFFYSPKANHTNSPNCFQKIIEIIIRLHLRGADVLPEDMLRRTAKGEQFPRGNYFNGFTLVERNLLTSPDQQEMYLRFHFEKNVLLNFASMQAITMQTNPFSFLAGGPLQFTFDAEKILARSVRYYHQFVNHIKDASYLGKDKNGWGFYVDVPQKMRLGSRLLRESWGHGGCGIQVDELMSKGLLVRHYFPLHNVHYLESRGLNTKWATLTAVFALNPFRQDVKKIMTYFGEKVGLYFYWIEMYCYFLIAPAFTGIAFGVLANLGIISSSLWYSAFSMIMVLWSFGWCKFWARQEALFRVRHGQDIEISQEFVRDGFVPLETKAVGLKEIYEDLFGLPLTLQRLANGSMVELVYPGIRRYLKRLLVTYPVVFLLTAILVTIYYFITVWRFKNESNQIIMFSCSIITVVVGLIFGKVFDVAVELLNKLENNRTKSEEETQYILKSFLFYFVNYYFSLFAIALLDSDTMSIKERFRQLNNQMLIICVFKPMIQNIQELLLPILFTQLRLRTQKKGSKCSALWSLLCCQRLREVEGKSMNYTGSNEDLRKEARSIWKQCQKEPYASTQEDYLEIILQYGYITMFAAVFPWGPLASLLYNALEIRIDAQKLVNYHQRPVAAAAATIGAWNTLTWLIAFLSVVTNSYAIVYLTPVFSDLGLTDHFSLGEIYPLVQYTLLIVIALIVIVLPSVPSEVLRTTVKRQLMRERATRSKLWGSGGTTASLNKAIDQAEAAELQTQESGIFMGMGRQDTFL